MPSRSIIPRSHGARPLTPCALGTSERRAAERLYYDDVLLSSIAPASSIMAKRAASRKGKKSGKKQSNGLF
jgi:hypothetical protein